MGKAAEERNPEKGKRRHGIDEERRGGLREPAAANARCATAASSAGVRGPF